MDIDKHLLEVELRTTKENLQRAKQRLKDMRSKLSASENSRIEMKVEVDRMERQLKRLTSQETINQSLKSATRDFEMQALKRSNGRLKRRISQLEEMNSSSRWRSGSLSLSLPRSSLSATPTTPVSTFDYDSGCWSSVSPSNSLESLDTTDSNLDDSSSIYSGVASVNGNHYTTGLYSQLEQLRGEVSAARQREKEATQEVLMLEQKMKRREQELSLDVRASQAENQSILIKTTALEKHAKELQRALDGCRCQDLEEQVEELVFRCAELQRERDAAQAREKELQEGVAAVNAPERVECETQTESPSLTSQSSSPSSSVSSSPCSSPAIIGKFVAMDAELKQFKAENHRLRLQLKVRDGDERHVPEERRSSMDNWTGSTVSLGRSTSVHMSSDKHQVGMHACVAGSHRTRWWWRCWVTLLAFICP